MQHHDHDVIVVGAGPSGSTAAEGLARRGQRVALVEEHAEIGNPVNCSGIVGVEAMERFDLPHDLVRHTLSSVKFHSPAGKEWRFEPRGPLAYAVDRSRFDQLLGRRAESAGAEILLGCRVTDIQLRPDGVVVEMKSENDHTSQLHAQAVVLATGAGIPLLRKLGWGTIRKRLLGVQTEIPMDVSEVGVYLGKEWAPQGFAWVMPVGDGMAKVGLLCSQDGPRFLERFLARPDLKRRTFGAPAPIQCSILPLGFLSRSYSDRMLVVGEAAGHIKATTCGGIYYGMLTAEIAADVLSGAIDDADLSQDRLSDYEVRWRDLLEDEIRMGLRLRSAFQMLGDSTLDRLVSFASRDGLLRLIHEKADFDWHRELISAVMSHSKVGRILGAA